MKQSDYLLELVDISKGFAGVRALDSVDFRVKKGEIRAVVGANGAGKSTLMKVIGGVFRPDKGEIRIKNKVVEPRSPAEAQRMGISVIYQELSLIPTLNVMANVFLNQEAVKGPGIIDNRKMLLRYQQIASELNFDIPPYIKVEKLSIAQRQMIEIMKTVSYDSEIVIMDEPTTSLTENEKEQLFRIITNLQKKGKTIIYISHMLEEIFLLADNITILKDGEKVGTYCKEELDQKRVAGLMTGSEVITRDFAAVRDRGGSVPVEDTPLFQVENLHNKHLNDINFQLYPGEILGLAGLVGSGRTELCRAIFGLDPLDTGKIFLEGKEINIKSPGRAITAGIGLIPEDRKNQGLILKHPIYQNSTLVQLKNLFRQLIKRNKEYQFTEMAVDKLNIKLNKITAPAKSLSGGNQQKVVVSKWLGLNLKVLIFDEPTKGIDVAAKEDIFQIINDFASKGVGIIFISSDLEEVIRLANRVLVIREGKFVKELAGQLVNEQEIVYNALDVK